MGTGGVVSDEAGLERALDRGTERRQLGEADGTRAPHLLLGQLAAAPRSPRKVRRATGLPVPSRRTSTPRPQSCRNSSSPPRPAPASAPAPGAKANSRWWIRSAEGWVTCTPGCDSGTVAVAPRFTAASTGPTKMAEVTTPTKMAICCRLGVAPTRYAVLRSWAVVPPLLAAMPTMAAVVRAMKRSAGEVHPRAR